MKTKFTIFLLIFTIGIIPKFLFAQSQAEIENVINEEDAKTKKKREKAEKISLKAALRKRGKEINEKNRLAKKEKKKTDDILVEDNIKLNNDIVDKTDSTNINSKKEAQVQNESANNKSQKEKDNKEPIEDVYADYNFRKLQKVGDKLMENGSFYNAIKFFKNALFKAKKDKQKVYLYKQLADANFFLRDYKLAKLNYEKAIELNTKGKKFPLLIYQLANTYKFLGDYESAIDNYALFTEKQKDNNKVTWEISRARYERKGCVFAQEYKNDTPKFKIENAGENVNGPFTDYGPEIVNNRLYFSKINSDKVVVLNNENIEKEYSKIYYSEIHKDEMGMFQDFAKNINKSKIHIGNPSFTNNGNTVYFTQCTLDNKMRTQCRIFVSKRVNNVWEDPEILNSNINAKESNNTHPQIVQLKDSTEILYFVSNREGGKGGKDIWYSILEEENGFSKARNLGFKINTRYNEVSPFYDTASKTLYFSSNGHTNFGGLDVFKISKNEEGEWEEEIENLGLPVNSSLDDYDFVINSSNTKGYLVSNRVGTTTLKSETCCDDIFTITPSSIDIYITGRVYVENATTRSILETADVYLYDNKTNEKISTIEYADGMPFFAKVEKDKEYKIMVVSDDFVDTDLSFSTKDIIKSDTLEYNLFLKNRDLTNHLLATVYYEFNKSKLRDDATDSLRKVIAFLEAYPNTIIEVGSHTDSKGSDKYNLALSERRSLAVKNYLIYQKEIPEERLINKSYGESMPAAPNKFPNGKDNPKGRDLNRRTEFKVVGYLKE